MESHPAQTATLSIEQIFFSKKKFKNPFMIVFESYFTIPAKAPLTKLP